MAKDVRTRRPDTPLEGGGTWSVAGCRNDVARLAHFSQCFPSGQHIWIGYAIIQSVMFTSVVCFSLRESGQGSAPHILLENPEFCSANIPPGCLTSGILPRRHSTRMSHIRNSSPPTFHPDISHPAADAGWERRAFQLPRSDISGSSNSAYPENFAANFTQCRSVLLKLPDICDRHFEIFCFRYFDV